jgi:hypothetical protein
MSRNRFLDFDDRPDPVELRGESDHPTRSELHADDVEPADFDEERLVRRFGPQGGFFAFENDDEMGEW